MSLKAWYALGFSLILGICIISFIVAPNAEFSGADEQGSERIKEIDPAYTPWSDSLWSPPSSIESLLFASQAAIGAMIIGYFIGNEHGKRAAKRDDEDHDRAEAEMRAD